MTGSSHPDIDAVVAQWNQDRRDRALAALSGNPALVTQIMAEIARLEAAGGPRELLKHDAVSQHLHRVLKALLLASEHCERPVLKVAAAANDETLTPLPPAA